MMDYIRQDALSLYDAKDGAFLRIEQLWEEEREALRRHSIKEGIKRSVESFDAEKEIRKNKQYCPVSATWRLRSGRRYKNYGGYGT